MQNNLDKAYINLVDNILTNGYKKDDRTGTGTISLFGCQIIHNMKEGFPLLTTKKMAWKQIVTELLWFLKGDTNIQELVKQGNYIWVGDAYKKYCKSNKDLSRSEFIDKIKIDNEFASKWGELGRVYGFQWRHFGSKNNKIGGFDQLDFLIKELKSNPDSRRLLVTAWNPEDIEHQVLPPCHYGFQIYTREMSVQERKKYDCHFDALIGEYLDHHITLDKRGVPRRAISLSWNQRSVDVGLGLPFNIASYGLLLEILADEVNMIPEKLIGNLGDTHIYNNHVDGLRQQMTLPSYDLPKLNIKGKFYSVEDFELINYKSNPKLELELSN